MVKHKLLTPSCILSIIGNSLISLDFLAIAIGFAIANGISRFVAVFVIAIIGLAFSLAGIIISSLALETKVITEKGRLFSFLALACDGLDFIFLIVEIILMFSVEFTLIIAETLILVLLFFVAIVFYVIALSQSKVQKEHVNINNQENSSSEIDIKKLYKLYQNNLITKEEFEQKREQFLENL